MNYFDRKQLLLISFHVHTHTRNDIIELYTIIIMINIIIINFIHHVHVTMSCCQLCGRLSLLFSSSDETNGERPSEVNKDLIMIILTSTV